ncbi:hypothetical protein [Nocardia xishanensis]|uniref:hypothetical protein n=1 Tax=Nocardia xishanensis TaxID=238964 RepID=UPI00082E267C|nr:hypothetical protein [Nocardia xishanensis]
MVLGIVLLVVCVIVLAALLRQAIGATIDRRVDRGLPGRYRRETDETNPSTALRASHASEPTVPEAEPVLEWADPAQVWSALDAENALLAALLARRIAPAEYRARMIRLARRCEPARPASGEE